MSKLFRVKVLRKFDAVTGAYVPARMGDETAHEVKIEPVVADSAAHAAGTLLLKGEVVVAVVEVEQDWDDDGADENGFPIMREIYFAKGGEYRVNA